MVKKRIIIVNNNMNIGGIQKSLLNLLSEFSDKYDITLLLFSRTGEYLNSIPTSVKIIESGLMFRMLGLSQSECSNIIERLLRSFLVVLTKVFGRSLVIKLMLLFERRKTEEYDFAISYMHNAAQKSFYGGCNEYVIKCVKANKKIAFIHTDYNQPGIDCKCNNILYKAFDVIVACSEGCKRSFLQKNPLLAERCIVIENCQNYNMIKELSQIIPYIYDSNYINFISITRLTHEKGVERAIEAISLAIKNNIRIRYYIVGSGVLFDKLKKQIELLGVEDSVFLLGKQENPYRFMLNADVLLIPSFNEAAPMVIQEARCLAIPILSTQTTSTHEMIEMTNSGWVCENTQGGLNLMVQCIASNYNEIYMKKEQMKKTIISNQSAVSAFVKMIEE